MGNSSSQAIARSSDDGFGGAGKRSAGGVNTQVAGIKAAVPMLVVNMITEDRAEHPRVGAGVTRKALGQYLCRATSW